ncbi:hypothetical protein TL5118_02180 [Thalassovita autumnalis]|uniref:Uncharacterized protein n=1 Tax=Thalassovita autumnalis TaxID=2072972 RepID=A0A0P1FXT7_9RHOB|nr:hypothetical protein TL5118_02180 [Thalassovita autumnalis]CUH73878.1 hypothetical protein TL5120_03695 [Thalassovita autumnalis]
MGLGGAMRLIETMQHLPNCTERRSEGWCERAAPWGRNGAAQQCLLGRGKNARRSY